MIIYHICESEQFFSVAYTSYFYSEQREATIPREGGKGCRISLGFSALASKVNTGLINKGSYGMFSPVGYGV